MNNIESRIVQITQADKQELSKAKKLFNKLVKQIDNQKKELSEWQTIMPIYQYKYSSEFLPLIKKMDECRKTLIYLLDNVYEDNKITKRERAKISDLICSMAPYLIINNENDRLKQIYDKYSDSNFDTEKQDAQNDIKLMMKDMFDLDIGEDDMDFSSPESLLAKVAQKMKQKLEQEESEEENREENKEEDWPKRKKSAKTLAKEETQKQEKQEISQSIKDVYRQLASSLHPDKEQDPQERIRKTALMQNINIAYKNKDLLTLLELQLEVEQINQSNIDNMPETRIMHYNKVLTNQSSELKQEILGIKQAMQFKFSTLADKIMSPKKIIESLNVEIGLINLDIKKASHDLKLFHQDLKNIKNFLKNYFL
jgi:hypothetical protein